MPFERAFFLGFLMSRESTPAKMATAGCNEAVSFARQSYGHIDEGGRNARVEA